ncbi:hypothetical protein LOTGIDRAFT_176015 [Lottia gigantea]|uniref:Uncharacterized protein n=1 Tax=Lottia gigantea TaxID=225164 RepID=V3ZZ65_LOTGI|nr:hypothetical protein LOTGIDRAFT_176015 [Lottia gigantea]ESO86311.1 hypothetical protein LOTGIDRAFT_176015 [Lottia gigantea]
MALPVFIRKVGHALKSVEGTCDVMKALKCTGYDLLSMNPLGIMQLEDADNLCSIIGDLEVCLKDTLGGCSITDKVGWVPVIDSAKFICNRLEEYKSASHCYLTKDTFENFKNCTQYFHNAASCRSFETFLNCVLTPIKRCSLKGAEILNGLFTAFTGYHIQIMNCSLPALVREMTTNKNISIYRSKTDLSGLGASSLGNFIHNIYSISIPV